MPAFPTLTELPTEAKSKELKAQLEADFKIAKKNGDLKKQQQQWIDISDGGEPAGKIYAINQLLKGISDSIGAATLTQMLSLPEKGSGAYTAILGEGAGNGKQKAYAELLAFLAKVLELTYPDFITATAAEADGPVLCIESLLLDIGLSPINKLAKLCEDASKEVKIGQDPFNYAQQIRTAFTLPLAVGSLTRYLLAWRASDGSENTTIEAPQSVKQLMEQWELHANFQLDLSGYVPKEGHFTDEEDTEGIGRNDLEQFRTWLRHHAAGVDKRNATRQRNSTSDHSETTMAARNSSRSRMEHDGHRQGNYQHQPIGDTITKQGGLYFCGGVKLGERNQKRVYEIGDSSKYAWVKSMTKGEPGYMEPLVCGARVWRGGMYHPEKCDRMHPPSALWCQIMKRNIKEKQKYNGSGNGRAKDVCRAWASYGACPRGDGCKFTHPSSAKGSKKKRKGQRYAKNTGGPGGGNKKPRTGGKTFGAIDHETQEQLEAKVEAQQQQIDALKEQMLLSLD